MTQIKGFKLVTAVVLVYKKTESDDKKNMTPFIRSQKQKQILVKVTLMIYLNQSILLLYKTNKHF